DMRMDDRLGVTAADFLQVLSEKELANMFRNFGGESYAQPIARKIKQASPVTTTRQLAEIVTKSKPPRGHLHPATKVFQALRIIVNSEIHNLEQAVPTAFSLLNSKGRLVTLAFHEGEDRFVKQYFKSLESKSQARLLTPKSLTPSLEEIGLNPRARSTKLRAIEKI
nr:16S rRNA (cytosine(1402)-N(4))-methyltransferase [Candidatus Woesebacteria bacterium]